jgi:antirestriction protein ArdC
MTTATRTRKSSKPAAAKSSSIVEIDWTATLIEALNAPGSLGNTYSRFYNYSFLNQIRLLMQGVNEPVATYRRWAELGFQVQKGSKAKTVLAPIIVTKRDKETGKILLNKAGKPQTVLVGFRESHTVFGFSDTDGDELPPLVLPTWDTDTALAALNVKRTKFEHSDGNTAGYSSEDDGQRLLAINPAAVHPAKTLLHELAHIVLGHTKALAEGKPEYHTGVLEFEAEATAYLVAKELELVEWDASESRAYIDHWLQGERYFNEETGDDEIEDFDKHAARIFSAANKILTAGRPVKTEAA